MFLDLGASAVCHQYACILCISAIELFKTKCFDFVLELLHPAFQENRHLV